MTSSTCRKCQQSTCQNTPRQLGQINSKESGNIDPQLDYGTSQNMRLTREGPVLPIYRRNPAFANQREEGNDGSDTHLLLQ
eukprot:6135877-Amphidinium_carterae.1